MQNINFVELSGLVVANSIAVKTIKSGLQLVEFKIFCESSSRADNRLKKFEQDILVLKDGLVEFLDFNLYQGMAVFVRGELHYFGEKFAGIKIPKAKILVKRDEACVLILSEVARANLVDHSRS